MTSFKHTLLVTIAKRTDELVRTLDREDGVQAVDDPYPMCTAHEEKLKANTT